ncbi:ARF/SAR superfamily, partial [Ramicandelaber brevisporus]
VLVYANKQDMPNAARGAELVEKLQLRNQNGRREWYVQESNFMTGDGLYEGLDWVAKHISKN